MKHATENALRKLIENYRSFAGSNPFAFHACFAFKICATQCQQKIWAVHHHQFIMFG